MERYYLAGECVRITTRKGVLKGRLTGITAANGLKNPFGGFEIDEQLYSPQMFEGKVQIVDLPEKHDLALLVLGD